MKLEQVEQLLLRVIGKEFITVGLHLLVDQILKKQPDNWVIYYKVVENPHQEVQRWFVVNVKPTDLGTDAF